MKINPRPLSVLAGLALAAAMGRADTVMIVSTGDSGAETERIAVSDIGKVTFSEGLFTVFGEESAPMKKMDISKISRISFASAESSVKSPGAASEVRLRQNPVADLMSADGVPAGSRAALYDLSGRRMLEASPWAGEGIDVSHLPSGMYLLQVNSQTIKVIKK